MTDREEGSVGIQFLIILLFLAAAVGAAAAIVSGVFAYQKRSEDVYFSRKALVDAAGKAVEALQADPTPEADGVEDPIWKLDGTEVDGVRYKIRDLSSFINANFVRKGVFEKTTLSRLLVPGKTAAELQQYREDSGLSPFPKAYDAYFTDEALRTAVGGYGWANINVCDEFALRSLCRAVTGSEATAETFHAKVRALLTDRKIVKKEEISATLGIDFYSLFPFVNAEPMMNVNFVAPVVLRQLMAYPDYSLQNAESKADVILLSREQGEIKPTLLPEKMGVDVNHPLLHYFGCTTWFWEVTTEKGEARCVSVIARIPEAIPIATTAKPQFRIIETRFEK